MPMTVLRTLLDRLVEEDLLEDKLTISWHGAEPLMAGLEWYETANGCIAEALGDRVEIDQVFQSNGVLINDAWCDYFLHTEARVGVSLDGSAAQDSARVNWAGRPSHALALRGIDTLKRRNVPWALLAVITREVMEDPQAFIDFVQSTGCVNLGFKVEETNVGHHSRLEQSLDVEDLYVNFVQTLWRAFPADGPAYVREFQRYRKFRDARMTMQTLPVTLIPLRNLTIAANGDFTIFSGELLFREDDRFVFGNVMDGPLLNSLKTQRFRDTTAEMLSGVKRCAAQCRHYQACGSFYISQKYAEAGTFDVAETLACRLEVGAFRKALEGV